MLSGSRPTIAVLRAPGNIPRSPEKVVLTIFQNAGFDGHATSRVDEREVLGRVLHRATHALGFDTIQELLHAKVDALFRAGRVFHQKLGEKLKRLGRSD